MSDTTQLIVGGIITILASGGLATIIVRYMERRKVEAETKHTNAQATDVLVQAGEKAVKILTEQLDKALARIDELEYELAKERAERRAEVADLRAHIRRLESES